MQTGAQRLGKAPANVYQTLGTLTQKGAVLVSDDASEKRTYNPIPPRQLMHILQQSFERRTRNAILALEQAHWAISAPWTSSGKRM